MGVGGKGCVRAKGWVMGQNEPQNEDSQGILVFGVTVEMQGDRSGTTGSYWGLRGAKDTAGALLRRGGVARVAQLSQWVGAWGPGRMYCVGGTQMDSLQVRPGE